MEADFSEGECDDARSEAIQAHPRRFHRRHALLPVDVHPDGGARDKDLASGATEHRPPQRMRMHARQEVTHAEHIGKSCRCR